MPLNNIKENPNTSLNCQIYAINPLTKGSNNKSDDHKVGEIPQNLHFENPKFTIIINSRNNRMLEAFYPKGVDSQEMSSMDGGRREAEHPKEKKNSTGETSSVNSYKSSHFRGNSFGAVDSQMYFSNQSFRRQTDSQYSSGMRNSPGLKGGHDGEVVTKQPSHAQIPSEHAIYSNRSSFFSESILPSIRGSQHDHPRNSKLTFSEQNSLKFGTQNIKIIEEFSSEEPENLLLGNRFTQSEPVLHMGEISKLPVLPKTGAESVSKKALESVYTKVLRKKSEEREGMPSQEGIRGTPSQPLMSSNLQVPPASNEVPPSPYTFAKNLSKGALSSIYSKGYMGNKSANSSRVDMLKESVPPRNLGNNVENTKELKQTIAKVSPIVSSSLCKSYLSNLYTKVYNPADILDSKKVDSKNVIYIYIYIMYRERK